MSLLFWPVNKGRQKLLVDPVLFSIGVTSPFINFPSSGLSIILVLSGNIVHLSTIVMRKLVSFIIMVFLVVHVCAQEPKTEAQGYWVIQNHIKSSKQSVVYFYSPDHKLMYRETVTGKKIRLNPKTIRRLNKVLHQTQLTWQKDKMVKENEQLLSGKL